MPRTKRAQIPMEPREYRKLQEVSRREGVPVAELVRRAVRERYLVTAEERRERVAEILGLDLPTVEWEDAEGEIADGHGPHLS